MSLSEEKLLILKMLQEGKITTDEAAKLLEALEGASRNSPFEGHHGRPHGEFHQSRGPKARPAYYDEVEKLRERIHGWKAEFNKNYKEQDFEKMIDDFTVKAEKVGKNVANVTFGAVDKLIDYVGSVVDTGSFNFFGAYPTVEKVFEADVIDGTDLVLEAVNGSIVVKKHQENKIFIRTKVKTPQSNPDNLILYETAPGSVMLKLVNAEYSSVSHEVFLPAVTFGKIRLSTRNSRIYVEDTKSAEFESITKNAAIELMGVTSDKIFIDTKNAKVSLNYVSGKDVNINTGNSFIEIKNIKAALLKAMTVNGKILVESVHSPEDGSTTIVLDLRTKNGDIKINMNDTDSRGYKLKAQTSNGGINLLIPGLKYSAPVRQTVTGRYVEAATEDYDTNPQKVDIYAETQNGYVEVVK